MSSHLCCHRKPQWPFSTWRSEPSLRWLCWGRRSLGKGWRRRSRGCLTLGASTWSGCAAPPERYRWTAPRWPKNCGRDRRWPPHQERAGHKLETEHKRLIFLVLFCDFVNRNTRARFIVTSSVQSNIYYNNSNAELIYFYTPSFFLAKPLCFNCVFIIFKYKLAWKKAQLQW